MSTHGEPMLSTLPPKPDQNSSKLVNPSIELAEPDISRIIEMAWEDRTPFEAIFSQFKLNEAAVIVLMRARLKPSSFRMWRERMRGMRTKHAAIRPAEMNGQARHKARHRVAQF